MSLRLRKILTLIVTLMLMATFVIAPSDTYAASKSIKTTAYRNTLKSGNTVYCTNAHRIFRVDLKKQQVTILATSKVGYTTNMKIKSGYLYFMETSQYGGGCRIHRINLKTGKKTILAKNTGPEFAIKGNKIYYNYAKVTNNDIKYKKRVMKLNGKAKKSTKYKAKMTRKLTNAKEYRVNSDMYEDPDWRSYDYIDYWLETPDGDIFLENYVPVI